MKRRRVAHSNHDFGMPFNANAKTHFLLMVSDVFLYFNNTENLNARRLNHDFIDDGQTLKKYINHIFIDQLARDKKNVCVALQAN